MGDLEQRGMILPGATIGVFGSGQLGRMLGLAARPMGYRFAVFAPDAEDSPAGDVADWVVQAAYADLDAVRRFASGIDVATFEFENVAAAVADAVMEAGVPVRPGGHVLHAAQNRLREKTFLAHSGLPVAPFCRVNSLDELTRGLETLGCPAVLKTAAFGYDGKGQVKIERADEAAQAWREIHQSPAILEAFVPFTKEVSVVAGRGLNGDFAHFGVIENIHQNHILDLSIAPARVSELVRQRAIALAHDVLMKLDVVGVLCVEFFVTPDEQLLINELAPRPHNSGHLTIDACLISQFELQLRTICGLPLGNTELLRPAVMVNLLGDLWANGEPDWGAALAEPNCKLHLYGKAEARPGRKMGHCTCVAEISKPAIEALIAHLLQTRARLAK
ncbi:MAG: 5-(carboxyamino)imidazole ribonucleotide synthase [Caldilineaceae bacterium]